MAKKDCQDTGQKYRIDKQLLFAEEYAKDLNGVKAAIRAGYSAKSAQTTASRLLSLEKVQKKITELKREISKRNGIDADWILSRLAEEAEADIADIYNSDGSIKSIHDWPKIWRQGLVCGVDVAFKLGGDGEYRIDKIKLSDRVKRLELIGKHVDVGAFKEKLEHTGKDGGPIRTEDLSDRDVARRIAYALSKGVQDRE